MDLHKKKLSRSILLLSFLLPLLITTLCFALDRVAPFGPEGLLKADAWAQYHPFLSLYRDTLLQGGSLEHTWSIGMGINFLPIFAYYLSSPLYLLCVLVPEKYLLHFMLALTVIKFSLAGLSFALFLSRVYHSTRRIIPFFALMYSLCAWSAGYYWNIIWLDVFALLPLLIVGTYAMLRESRFRLYVVALALCFWCNYYLSYCCCIFVLLCFIGYHICRGKGWKNFFRSFVRFGLGTLLALALAAVLVIPTLLGMQNTASAEIKDFPLAALTLATKSYDFSFSFLFEALAQVMGRTLTNSPPSFMDGLPNIFCGFSTLILGFTFLFNKTFTRRDRIFHGCLLLFFVLSCIFKVLDYIWHGFHFPNMLPNRFSFLFSFVLLNMAFRGYIRLHALSLKRILLSLACGLVIIGCGLMYRTELSFGYYALPLALGVFAATALIIFLGSKCPLPKLTYRRRMQIASLILALLFLGESYLCISVGIDEGLTHDTAMDHGLLGQELYKSVSQNDPELFYRTEFAHGGTSNDGALHHNNGTDVFSSSALVNFGNFASALGLRAWPESNSTTYEESTAFTNALCGIKYLIGEEGTFKNPEDLTLVDKLENYEIYATPSYMGVGFMTDSALADFTALESVKNPFAEQNELFRLATGLEGDLYRFIFDPELEACEGCTLSATENNSQFRYTVAEDMEYGTFTIRYTMEESGLLSMATRMGGGDICKIYRNGEFYLESSIHARAILNLGYVEPGDVFEMVYTSEHYKEAGINLFVTLQNDELLQEGLSLLSDEVWNITYVDNTTISGTITAKEDGFFYSSIAYEPGWTVTVDGVEIPIATTYDPSQNDAKLTDSLISFPLSAGDHEITMSYRTPGLRGGLCISLTALILYVALILCKKYTIVPNLIPTKKETCND